MLELRIHFLGERQDLYAYCLLGALCLVIPHSGSVLPQKLVVGVVIVLVLVKGIEIWREK